MCRDKGGAACIAGATGTTVRTLVCSTSSATYSRSGAGPDLGFRAALALFVYFLRAKAQQKHQGKRDAFPGRQGQRYTLVLLCRWRPPGTPSKPRRLAVVCYADRRQIRILWRGCHSGKISPRIVTRGPLL